MIINKISKMIVVSSVQNKKYIMFYPNSSNKKLFYTILLAHPSLKGIAFIEA